jgi:hypothetical protein
MDDTLSKEVTGWREGRRLRAWESRRRALDPAAHRAEALGVSKGALSQWMRRGREGGVGRP